MFKLLCIEWGLAKCRGCLCMNVAFGCEFCRFMVDALLICTTWLLLLGPTWRHCGPEPHLHSGPASAGFTPLCAAPKSLAHPDLSPNKWQFVRLKSPISLPFLCLSVSLSVFFQAMCTISTTSPMRASGNVQWEMVVESQIRFVCVFILF